MQFPTRRLRAASFGAYVSEHRFRLTVALSLLVLVVMIGVIYSTIGFGPPLATSTSP